MWSFSRIVEQKLRKIMPPAGGVDAWAISRDERWGEQV
jgi:hypothetical protein